MSTPLTTKTVAQRLSCGEATVRRHDAELRPIRDSSGRRLYDEQVVAEYAVARAARRA